METAPQIAAETPHYHGHRDRVRQRFLKDGADTLQDYELLELMLFQAIPRRDVKPLAKDLLKRFGGLPALFAAPAEELAAMPGISDTTAIALKSVQALALRMLKQDLMNKPVLNNWKRLLDYCTASMVHETREHFRILFMNRKNELIADEIQHSGTVDTTAAYPREVVKRALQLGATALVLVHNHPSGDPKPSEIDIAMTDAIVNAGKPLSIKVHDHIIIARGGYISFKSLDLL